MFQSYGLYGHIQTNRIRSAILLAGFVLLLQALTFSLMLIANATMDMMHAPLSVHLANTAETYKRLWPVAMLVAFVWFAIAYVANTAMTNYATGARSVTREEEPRLYNALENLCISRGITMPKLQIIDDAALNAFASGLNESQYAVTVTKGLIDALDNEEMEAVLAHELTHIRNKDTQLLVVAIIFAGVFAFFGDLIMRGWDFPYGFPPRSRRSSEDRASSSSESDNTSSGSKGGGGAIAAIILAVVVIIITYGISTLIRFALSRSREYLADAGAVELTKNPDALIRALKKIDTRAHMEVPSRMEAFFIENPLEDRITGWFATHPSMANRIEALVQHGGGREAIEGGKAAVAR
ncbi:MAG: M48 family metallopeptidase [Hyphomicrobiaceae bacterium]